MDSFRYNVTERVTGKDRGSSETGNSRSVDTNDRQTNVFTAFAAFPYFSESVTRVRGAGQNPKRMTHSGLLSLRSYDPIHGPAVTAAEREGGRESARHGWRLVVAVAPLCQLDEGLPQQITKGRHRRHTVQDQMISDERLFLLFSCCRPVFRALSIAVERRGGMLVVGLIYSRYPCYNEAWSIPVVRHFDTLIALRSLTGVV